MMPPATPHSDPAVEHRPLHIVMFTDFHPNTLGGIAVAVTDHRRALERRGHLVTVVAASATESDGTESDGAARTQPPPTWLVTLSPTGGRSINGFPLILPTTAQSARVRSELARRAPVDVVHVHTTYGVAVLGARFARRHHLPLVQTMHSRDDVFVEHNATPALLAGIVMRLAHRSVIPERGPVPRCAESAAAHHVWCAMIAQARAADLVIAPSEHFARELRAHGLTGPLSVISNGVDDDLLATGAAHTDPISPDADRETLRLVWCGRLSAEKRPLVAIDAVARTPGCRLDVFGDGELYRTMADHIADNGAADRIVLHGRRDRGAVIAAMAGADALLFTSNGFDTQGLVLLEALAVGLPVIYCDPELAETIPDGAGLRTTDPSAAAFAATLHAIQDDPSLLAAAHSATRGTATPQSRVTDELIAAYRRLVALERDRRFTLPADVGDIPTAPGGLPAIGHSLVALRRGLGFIRDLGSVGPVVRLQLGTRPAYLLTNPDLVRQVGFGTAGAFHRADLQEAMHEAIREASNVLSGPRHSLRRRQVAPALRQRRLARYALTTAEISDRWARELPADDVVDLKIEAHGLILEAVTSTLFRADFGRDALRQIRETVPWLLGQVIIRGALPTSVRRLRVRANRRFARESAQLRTAIGEVVSAYRADGIDRGDVLSALVGQVDDETGIGLTDDEIIDELLLMVAAGVGSTASILAWVWYEIAREDAVGHAVASEVRRVVGEGPVRGEQVSELTYLRQVISETLRIWGPWISTQTADGAVTFTDDESGSLTLPDGAMVVYSPYQILHDSRYYESPETFDPGRWAPERSAALDNRANLAFGVGDRHCPGATFAMSTILLSTAALYSRWTPELADTTAVRPSTTDFVAAPAHLRMRLRRAP